MSSSDSQYKVTQYSPVASHDNGHTRTGMLGYGWDDTDPFVVSVRLTLGVNTFSVDADKYPGGLSCCQCHGKMAWGGFGCDAGGGYLMCLACGRDTAKLVLDSQDWKIGLALFLALMQGNDTAEYMPGEVQMYRAANGEVTLVLSNRDLKHSIRMTAPYSNLTAFVHKVDQARGMVRRNIEQDYLDSGVSQIETWANKIS